MMKEFKKPCIEVIKLNGNIVTASGCGCFDGVDDWGRGNNCAGADIPGCCQCTTDIGPGGNCVDPNA